MLWRPVRAVLLGFASTLLLVVVISQVEFWLLRWRMRGQGIGAMAGGIGEFWVMLLWMLLTVLFYIGQRPNEKRDD